MDELINRFWREIVDRPGGPLALRFYLQPFMATLFALRDGVHDAHNQKPAYFWSLLIDPARRTELLQHGWKSIGKIFVLAMSLDIVYQVFVLRGFRPVQTLFIAFALAVAPYLVFRGPVNRIARHYVSHRQFQ